MKTELVETRGERERDEEAGERDEGTADHRPGGYEHPWSGHTNALDSLPITYIRKHRKQHQQVSAICCEAFRDCGCCESAAMFPC